MIISKKQRIDKLLIRDIKIFKSESIFFPVILSFIIVLFYFRGISSATTDLHIASGHTKANSDSAHLTLQRKNDKRKFFDSSDNDAEPWSNAFNFEKSWKASVDPRTGVLMVHFKVGGLLSNIGHGPDINLQINYNSNTVADPDGIGSGWSWNLTHFNHTTDQLTTTNGQIFWLHQAGRNHWKPLYHKLYDIKIAGDKSRHFTITYANGLREILSHDGYETRLEQQNGWGVNFIYYRGTHLLQSVIDDEGNKITIDRSESYLDIISHKSDGKPAIIRIKKHNNKPDKLVFLADHQSEKLSISLNYNNRLLNHIVYPSGLEKKFIFNCTNEMKISVLHSNHFYSLCVVTAEETDPGAGQPVMKVRHFYSRANVNDHNYLGFNSGLTALAGSKRDILFDSPADYSYRTVTDNGLVKEIHTYNKYHLLIDDKMISNHTGKILSETENFFCNTKIPDGCSQTSLSKLPATYGLPLKIVNRVWGNASGFPAVTVETKSYNSSGQIIRSTDAYGRVTITHYCPFEGDIACPAQSHGWFFSVLPKSITSYPAPMINNIQPQIPNKIYNFYRRKTNLNGNGYILILDHQIRKADNKRIILKRHYYLDRTNILTYGLLRQTILSDTTINSPHAIIRDYNYTQNNKNHSRTTDISIELSPNKRQRISSVTTSLFTNQVLEKVSSCGLKKTDYHYDTFNRLIQTDLDKGTAFAATLHYQYVVAPGNNYFIVTKVNGLQQKIVFDNAGREIMRFNQMISASGDAIPGHWQLKKSLHYDNYGHVTEQKNYKLKTTGQSYTLKTIKSYDDMGRISHINLPNGEMDFRLYDNPDRCMISYQQRNKGEHTPVYIVQMNLLGKQTKKRVVSAFLEPLPSVKSLCSFKKMASDTVKTETTMYDGWGRPVITEDVMGRVTRTHYNALGHPDDITDPVGNHIHLVYDLNGKVTEHWALPVNGGRYLLSSAGYNSAGKILCKAGEDGKKTTFTYTQTGQLATAITPDGHKFLWQYNEAGLPVAKYIDGKVLLQTSYNHITAQPIKKQDISGVTTWKYSVDGLIEEEKHTGKNGYPDYYLSWNYNSERKIISSADITGDMTHIKYDRLGRIAVLSYQNKRGSIQILYTPNYEAFSRINTIHYGSGLQRTIHYDGWGNQLDIADTLDKQLLSRWQFNYNADNNIVRLRQQAENNQEAILKYQYDQLDNLVSMYCNGSFGLPLCPRDTAFSRSDLNKAPVITSQS
ncbi:MAG: hypothetical protein OXC48_03065, partial [Endozoicomonadaceae bacterium]|nr:hypothetical protein [Endozoicomonadaceae bacterium]